MDNEMNEMQENIQGSPISLSKEEVEGTVQESVQEAVQQDRGNASNLYMEKDYGNAETHNSRQYSTPDYNYVNQGESNRASEGYGLGSMVCGILSLLGGCCIPYVNIILSIISIVLGVISLKREENEKAMAIVGIVTSIVAIVFLILVTVIFVVLAINTFEYGYYV